MSRPDLLTVLVDLRNVSVADAANQVPQATKKGPVAGVTLEQATSDEGGPVARVRVALASPSAYKVRSARNVIRLELDPEPEMARANAPLPELMPAARAVAAAPVAATVAATQLDKVRADHTRTSTTITLAGNGRLTPSSLTESDDQPRRLVLDFPNVSPAAAARTGIDSVFVKQVRVTLNSREPVVTRVVMDISSSASYHVERTGPDGRDLAVVFEGRRAGGGAVLVAPPTGSVPESAGRDKDEDTISLEQAMANVASITPKDPMTALAPPAPVASRPAPAGARLAPPVQPFDPSTSSGSSRAASRDERGCRFRASGASASLAEARRAEAGAPRA